MLRPALPTIAPRPAFWLLAGWLLVSPFAGTQAAAQTDGSAELAAPTRLYQPPASYFLLPLTGFRVDVRYTPGSLDRAANLQSRLELLMRSFDRWINAKHEIDVYVLSREAWEEAQYDLAYGLPLRVGKLGLAAPAEGDDGTVEMWSGMLDGLLPKVPGLPIRGTPEQAATMALADVLVQLQAAEILVDEVGLAGDQHWVRGLVTHLASLDFFRRKDPARIQDIDSMFFLLTRDRGPKAMSVRDYDGDLSLRDWFWFQAQFHEGARTILDKTGKGALKKLKKLRKKDGGVLRGDRLLKEWKDLNEWFYRSFSAVSLRTDL